MDKKADGGRVGLSGSLKKFLERRNFLKTIVGNSPEAEENARILQKILDEQKEFKKFLDKNPRSSFLDQVTKSMTTTY